MGGSVNLQPDVSSPAQVVPHVSFFVCHALAGISSPHQQSTPSDRPMTSLPSWRHTSWQLPGDWQLYGPWFSSGVPVAKHPMLVMALAGRVTVGVVMGFLILVGESLLSATATMAIEATARAEASLM